MAAGAPPRGGELRLLCLHGYGQNAERFRARTGALRKALRGRARLLYLDAPHHLPAEKGGAAEEEGGAGPRGWWRPGQEPECGAAAEEAVAAVAEAVAGWAPVDGLLGFSQGAALAGLVCALREGGDGRFRGLRLALLVGGFPVGAAAGAGPGALRVPSLHVFGRDDRVIPAAESRALAERFARPVLLAHPGGHCVPAGAEQRAAYLAFMRRLQGHDDDHDDELDPPPPGPSATSLRGSGKGPPASQEAAAGRSGEPGTGDPQGADPDSPASALPRPLPGRCAATGEGLSGLRDRRSR
ncbi:esterase OVCA2 [Erythrolamprus reginae]|uniref:esterase OVCA2 n=1 Tax=Erythrolamprus reginae TaxID=121349 RepID=UPI00396C862C